MPVIGESIPPHVARRVQRVDGEELLIEEVHGPNAICAFFERNFIVPNHFFDRAIQRPAHDRPKSLFELFFGKSFEQEGRLCKQFCVESDHFSRIKLNIRRGIPRLRAPTISINVRRDFMVEDKVDKLFKRAASDIKLLMRFKICHDFLALNTANNLQH